MKNRLLVISCFTSVLTLVLTVSMSDAHAVKTQKRKRSPIAQSALSDVCKSVVPLQLLIKTTAGGHITAGPRVTGYSVICSSKQCINGSRASFYYSNGKLAGQVGYYGRWVGNGRARYYGGTNGAPQHFASAIAKNAKKLADRRLYLNLNSGGKCVAFNAVGRNGSPF